MLIIPCCNGMCYYIFCIENGEISDLINVGHSKWMVNVMKEGIDWWKMVFVLVPFVMEMKKFFLQKLWLIFQWKFMGLCGCSLALWMFTWKIPRYIQLKESKSPFQYVKSVIKCQLFIPFILSQSFLLFNEKNAWIKTDGKEA